MHYVTSRQNPLFKRLIRLARGSTSYDVTSDLAADNRVALLEGVHLCQEWLRHKGQPMQAVFAADKLEQSTELQELAARLDRATPAATMPSVLLKGISHVAASQGVLFQVGIKTCALPGRIQQTCLWLDRIQDPGNVGTLLRTAAAAGVKSVFLSAGCAHVWSARVLRSAQGAHFALHLYEDTDLLAAVDRLDIPLYAAALRRDAVSLYQSPVPEQCAWIFGNEGQGVDRTLQALADKVVYIPQEAAVESLNVAIAAGIFLFEQRRRQLG